jgi:hypothetical protein
MQLRAHQVVKDQLRKPFRFSPDIVCPTNPVSDFHSIRALARSSLLVRIASESAFRDSSQSLVRPRFAFLTLRSLVASLVPVNPAREIFSWSLDQDFSQSSRMCVLTHLRTSRPSLSPLGTHARAGQSRATQRILPSHPNHVGHIGHFGHRQDAVAVEKRGIEPLTSCLQSRRSTS